MAERIYNTGLIKAECPKCHSEQFLPNSAGGVCISCDCCGLFFPVSLTKEQLLEFLPISSEGRMFNTHLDPYG